MPQAPQPTEPPKEIPNDPLSDFARKIDILRVHANEVIDAAEGAMKGLYGVKVDSHSDTTITLTSCGRRFMVKCLWLATGSKGLVQWMELFVDEEPKVFAQEVYDDYGNLQTGGVAIVCKESGDLTFQKILRRIQRGDDYAFPFETFESAKK